MIGILLTVMIVSIPILNPLVLATELFSFDSLDFSGSKHCNVEELHYLFAINVTTTVGVLRTLLPRLCGTLCNDSNVMSVVNGLLKRLKALNSSTNISLHAVGVFILKRYDGGWHYIVVGIWRVFVLHDVVEFPFRVEGVCNATTLILKRDRMHGSFTIRSDINTYIVHEIRNKLRTKTSSIASMARSMTVFGENVDRSRFVVALKLWKGIVNYLTLEYLGRRLANVSAAIIDRMVSLSSGTYVGSILLAYINVSSNAIGITTISNIPILRDALLKLGIDESRYTVVERRDSNKMSIKVLLRYEPYLLLACIKYVNESAEYFSDTCSDVLELENMFTTPRIVVGNNVVITLAKYNDYEDLRLAMFMTTIILFASFLSYLAAIRRGR